MISDENGFDQDSLSDKRSIAARVFPSGRSAFLLPRKPLRLHDPRRLDNVVLLVDDDDAAGIHQAVGDEAEHRRCDRGPIEIEFAARFHQTQEPLLLLEKGRDDRRSDVWVAA